MTLSKVKWKNIDDYINSHPKNIQVILNRLRETIKKAAPEAEETISYSMPAFKLHGMLVYFAMHTSHVGFYPEPSGIEAFKKEISAYEWAKGSVKFPVDKPLPLDLVSKIVKFRMKENFQRVAAKQKNK